MESHTVSAGFTLAVGLFAWAVIGEQPITVPCVDPVERDSVEGRTTVVACNGNPSSDAPLRGPARRLFGHRVDLNCSDPLTLQTLAGIGPARAQAIVDERSRGRYERVEDLTRVHGIGPKTLARLRAELVVRPPHSSLDSPLGRAPSCRTNSRLLHRHGHHDTPSQRSAWGRRDRA